MTNSVDTTKEGRPRKIAPGSGRVMGSKQRKNRWIVFEVNVDGEVVSQKLFPSQPSIAKEYGVTIGVIYYLTRGKNRCKFKYASTQKMRKIKIERLSE